MSQAQTKQPGKLHELLAAEPSLKAAEKKLREETALKFGKPDTYFMGISTVLKLTADSTGNLAAQQEERAGSQLKEVTTSVHDTLKYFFGFWNKSEDLQYQKNVTNTRAVADIELNGQVLMSGVPIDEIMGLENRVTELRGLFLNIPTLDASKRWVADENKGAGFWRTAQEDVRIKTAKIVEPLVLYAATEHHPAQVKETSRDVTVGTFTTTNFSGAITAQQKADLIALADDLIVEIKKARQRANAVEAETGKIGNTITDLFLQVLAPASA